MVMKSQTITSTIILKASSYAKYIKSDVHCSYSRHNVMRLCAGMSPSPTRRSFATRRSMSPIAMRPSPLGSVKRKFDMVDDSNNSCSTSSQPLKKFFTER